MTCTRTDSLFPLRDFVQCGLFLGREVQNSELLLLGLHGQGRRESFLFFSNPGFRTVGKEGGDFAWRHVVALFTMVREHLKWCIYILWNVGIRFKDVAAFCDLVPFRTKFVINIVGYRCVHRSALFQFVMVV